MSNQSIFEAIPLPTDFRGTPEQLFEAMLARMRLVQEGASFVISDVMPTSNEGPWLKQGREWWVWNEDQSTYVPQSLSYLTQQVSIGSIAPDPAVYQLWVKLDSTTLTISGIYYFAGVDAGWITTPAVNGALPHLPRVGSVSWMGFPLPDATDAFGVISPTDGAVLVEPYGQVLDQATYPRLYAYIGSRFMSGPDLADPTLAGKFRLPNYRGRLLWGRENPGDEGTLGGAKTTSLSVSNLPAHDHELIANVSVDNVTSPLGPNNHVALVGTHSTNSTEYILGGSNTTPTLGKSAQTGGGAAFGVMNPHVTGLFYMVAGYKVGGQMV